jgi:hypothetical protein
VCGEYSIVLSLPGFFSYQTGCLEEMTTDGVFNGRGSEGGDRAQDSSVEAQSPRMSNNPKGDKSARTTSFPGPVYKPTRSMSPPSPASTSGGHTASKLGLVYNAKRSATSPRSPPRATLNL